MAVNQRREFYKISLHKKSTRAEIREMIGKPVGAEKGDTIPFPEKRVMSPFSGHPVPVMSPVFRIVSLNFQGEGIKLLFGRRRSGLTCLTRMTILGNKIGRTRVGGLC
jgi:hypothetical protein